MYSTLEYTERKTNSFSFSQSDGLPSVNINKALPDRDKQNNQKNMSKITAIYSQNI